MDSWYVSRSGEGDQGHLTEGHVRRGLAGCLAPTNVPSWPSMRDRRQSRSKRRDSPLRGQSPRDPLPYVDHFGLSPSDLRAVLSLALSSGGEFAEIFMEYATYDFVNMEEDIIKETAEAVSLGLGIRVLRGDRTGFGYTNDLSMDKVRNTAVTAAAIACGKAAQTPPPPL